MTDFDAPAVLDMLHEHHRKVQALLIRPARETRLIMQLLSDIRAAEELCKKEIEGGK